MASTSKDLGIATAYGYAKSKGYLGTEEEFAQLMADYATVGQQAAESASEAATKARLASNHATEAAGQATVARRQAEAAASSASTASSMKDQAAEQAYLAASARSAAQEAASSVSASAEQIAQNTSDIAALGSAKATAIINTASGAIASFSDGADSMPVKKLVVSVEPQQDLHGYDNPWPGGGGKNKLQLLDKTITQSSVTFTSNAETGLATISGTATADTVTAIAEMTLPAGNYIYTSGVEESFSTYDSYVSVDAKTVARGNDSLPPGNAFTLAEDATVRVLIRQRSGVTTSRLTFYPMIRLATETDPTFAPYKNICLISGWTGCEATRAGKNILPIRKLNAQSVNGLSITTNDDGSYHISGTATANSTILLISSDGDDNYIIVPPGRYITSIGYPSDGKTLNVALKYTAAKGMSSDPVFIPAFYKGQHYFEVTEPTKAYVYFYIQLGATLDAVFYPGLYTANSSTETPTYEPYSGTEISVTFPSEAGTVYGGTLTINPDRTGTLVVEDAAVDMGTLTWAKRPTEDASAMVYRANISGRKFGTDSEGIRGQCSQYSFRNNSSLDSLTNNMQNGYFGFQATVTGVVVRDDRYTTAEDFIEAVSGVTLVYPLANPITYQLTSEQISGILTTLYGTNNIWADCGDVTVEYTADTKLYIQQLTQPTEDDMTADNAIASGTFFMIGNNLYLATSQIAAGATITPGTNATQLSLADALNQLNT